MKKILLTALTTLALTGCVSNLDQHGHLVEEEDLHGLQPGHSTKEEVMKQLGSPSSVSTFHDNQWYYIAESRDRVLFFLPRSVESHTTIMNFDDNGVLSSVDFRGEEDKEMVAHVNRETPTAGHSFGFFEQMFGNVGRFGGKDPDAPGSDD